MMKLLGENGVAAITIMIYTQFLLSALYIGFSMGVAPVISYNYGKQEVKQLKNVFSICMRFIVFVSVTVFAVAFIFGSPLVGIFAEKGTPVYEFVYCGSFCRADCSISSISNTNRTCSDNPWDIFSIFGWSFIRRHQSSCICTAWCGWCSCIFWI